MTCLNTSSLSVDREPQTGLRGKNCIKVPVLSRVHASVANDEFPHHENAFIDHELLSAVAQKDFRNSITPLILSPSMCMTSQNSPEISPSLTSGSSIPETKAISSMIIDSLSPPTQLSQTWKMTSKSSHHTQNVSSPLSSNLPRRDCLLIGTPDHQIHCLTWHEVKEIITLQHLNLLARMPSENRKYVSFTRKVKEEYGSVSNYLLTERLEWNQVCSSWFLQFLQPGPPKSRFDSLMTQIFSFFVNWNLISPFIPGSFCIRYNDWPYALDPSITHLIVWCKFAIPDDCSTGRMSKETFSTIDKFVRRTFSVFPPESVLWFRNWKSLKSVHTIEHFHVLIHNPDPKEIAKLTNHVPPLYKIIQIDDNDTVCLG